MQKTASTTPLIRYSLKERGRRHVGQPRSFNIRAICDAINGPACQERVATRGLVGYYGHMPRIRFGMNPVEGVLDGGKYVPIEPAFITTHLKADYDGNVEHRAEFFLETTAGRLAAKLFDSRMGGFSSAIDTKKPEFHGLDYVLEPNFLQNSYRGVVLDDVMGTSAGGLLTYDDVYAAEHDEQTQAMALVLDGIQAERVAACAAFERLQSENEQLLSMLTKQGVSATQALDGVFTLPIAVAMDAADRMQRDARYFRAAPELPVFVAAQVKAAAAVAAQQEPFYTRLLNQLTR